MFNQIKTTLLCLILVSTPALVMGKTIKIATVSPEGTYWMKQMREGAKLIKERTDGRVKFKFYPGGVMGSDENVLRKIRIGQLHGGAITIGYLNKSASEVTLYGLPFLFSSFEDAAAIRKITDPMISNKVEQNGFVNFGFAQGGFTYLMSKEPIRGFEDVRKQKSWIPDNSAVGLAVYDYVGVTPVPLAYADVLTALQTGLIDNVITSPIGALALQWHTYMKYAVDMPLNYIAATLIVDKKVFYKLKKEDQDVVREVMTDVYKRIDKQNERDSIAARQALINQGIEFVSLTDEEKQEWLKAGDHVIREMINEFNYSSSIYNAVVAHKKDAPRIN